MAPTSDTDDIDERLESIPWAHLTKPTAPDRRPWLVLAAVAVVVAAVTASAARTLSPAPPLTAPSDIATAAPPDSIVPFNTAPGSPPVSTAVEAPISEADLRAVDPSAIADTVAAYGEWFMAEWFTVDGSAPNVGEFFEDDAPNAVLDSSARSFAESATALSVTALDHGHFEVVVLMRTLSSFGDGPFVRQPARAFAVPIVMTDAGPAILDMPAPVPVPVGVAAPIETTEAEAPESVVRAAVELTRTHGLPDESTVESAKAGDLWRISMVVRDSVGVPWISVIWVEEDGQRAAPPL